MRSMYVKRLDGAIPSTQFCDCENIEVRTKMGAPVTHGTVESVSPFGVIVRESDGGKRFFKESTYIFAAPDRMGEPDVEVLNSSTSATEDELDHLGVDDRVAEKLRRINEADSSRQKETGASAVDPKGIDDIGKPEKGDKKSIGNKSDSKESSKSDPKTEPTKKDGGDDKKEKEKKDDKGKDKSDSIAKTDSSVDVDKLPDDIKNAISSAKDMDEQQLNNVLGEISDAAMKGLKRSGVLETNIYGVVQQIQDASYEILTGKKPPKE